MILNDSLNNFQERSKSLNPCHKRGCSGVTNLMFIIAQCFLQIIVELQLFIHVI